MPANLEHLENDRKSRKRLYCQKIYKMLENQKMVEHLENAKKSKKYRKC